MDLGQAWTNPLDGGTRARKTRGRTPVVGVVAGGDAEQRIASALAGDIKILYQPIANLHNGRVVGFESLSRFNDPRPPDVWFKEAASIGRGVELELAAVRRALANVKSLPKGAYLSVNVSPEAALSADLVKILERVPADRIVLEITEHARVDDYKPLEEALAGFRDRGLRIAIDDVGSGFSTLSHVLQLRPEVLKLDRELVHGIQNDIGRSALIASLVDFASSTGSKIVAEGVEEHAEAAALRMLGVRIGQGYHIARPGPDLVGPRDVKPQGFTGAGTVRFRFTRHARTRKLWRRRLAAGVVAAMIGLPAFSAAAANAEPGGVLWKAKLGIEKARLVVERDPAQDVALHIEFMNRRLEEISSLVASDADRALIGIVGADMSAHARAALALVGTLEGSEAAGLLRRLRAALAFNEKEMAAFAEDECRGGGKACSALRSVRKRANAVLVRARKRPAPKPAARKTESTSSSGATSSAGGSQPAGGTTEKVKETSGDTVEKVKATVDEVIDTVPQLPSGP